MSEAKSQIEQAATAWLARKHSGNWNAADEKAHAQWLAADPAHPVAWFYAQAAWEKLADLRPFAAADLRAARRKRTATPRWQTGLALAGICALVAGLVMVQFPGSFADKQTYQTARGEQRTVMLADNSSVELNTASKLEIDYSLGCRCLRLLQGEAVFKASHGDLRTFEVQVGKAVVRDIGTEFWIRQEPARLAVAVIEGAVEISPQPGIAYTRLSAGDRLAYDSSSQPLNNFSTQIADLIAWRTGNLVFRDTPLTEVLTEFARYHNVNIEMDSRMADYHLSGRFASKDLEGLLKLLESAYPVNVQQPSTDRLRLQFRRS
ncbi:MAG: FecR domain-containing protein [Gallionella sp.]